ncbi:AAA family ATPase [Paenibacillus motobuensis]|uniref:Nuclease SbcCD subunit C n=1 Tax=Paenibacillus motobuensis TaxID=295324 RepID=A0ABP3I5N2_9BACL
MKKIILERLTLRNFKGFREFILSTNGGNVDAFGDNGTGKTTIFDAFTWLLFGKDSANRSEQLFEIKELDSFGNVLRHKLEHEVEADLLVNGRRRTFRRIYSEKWTKKRGSATDSFEGHTTDYYIDGVPAKKSEYDSEVDSLIKEDLFRLLTSPGFFNEQLKKEERRKVLLEICGDITDAEVIHSNPKLSRLPAILGDRDVENHRRTVAAKCKDINKEIGELPIRISEAQRSQPDISGLDEELLLEDIDDLRSRIKTKNEELIRIQNGSESSVKEMRIREIESELLTIQSRLQSNVLDKVAIKRDEVNRLQSEFDSIRRKIDDNQHRIRQNERTIESRNQEAERLKAKWNEVNAQEFEHHHDENCPACGQALPTEQIQEAHVKAMSSFNLGKAHRLEQISAEGKAAKDEVRHFEHDNARLMDEIERISSQSTNLQERLVNAEAELSALRSGLQDPKSDPEYQRLLEEKDAVRSELAQLNDSLKYEVSRVQQEIRELQAHLDTLEVEKAKFAQVRKTEERIAELEQQERELAAEYERLQEELFLTEEFTRSKVALLDSKINSKFKYARFRLFEDQLNGGVKEVCDTLYNGVPYDGGLNNAARINVGLDIINTLSEHYGFSAPIFIDNAEAVTQLIDTDAQVIRLIVSESDKKLRVETKNSSMQEAI